MLVTVQLSRQRSGENALSQAGVRGSTDPKCASSPRKALSTLSQFYLYPETDTGREVEQTKGAEITLGTRQNGP